MKPTEIVKHRVTHKGAVKVNYAFMYKKGRCVRAIGMDMCTKYAEVSCITGDEKNIPGIHVSAIEGSLNLNKKFPVDEPTAIVFPEYAGWDIWSSTVSKYTIYLCFVKTKSITTKK